MAGGKAVLRAYEASSNIDSNTSQVRLQLYWENGDTKVPGVPGKRTLTMTVGSV